ncbi:MAG: DUF3422 family protein [Nitrospirae bacterium]|nr:MAG: DUF3422 family protein [Nitrospirota bacterium]
MSLNPRIPQPGFLQHIHEPPKRYLKEWLDVPAHIHHMAYRMANPPTERPQSREEFRHLLQCLTIPDEDCVVHEKLGYGVKTAENGDRLVVAWEAHTEYYSYQIWHLPADREKPLEFGAIGFPGYYFPFSPLGIRINALDMIICPVEQMAQEQLKGLLPGPQLYGSQVFGQTIHVATTFTPDGDIRERYYIWAPTRDVLLQHLLRLTDTLVAIENYTHLILLPFQAFGRAVDHVHEYEQRHLYQRSVIMNQLETATPQALQHWLTVLSKDFLAVSRMAESMRYKLSAAPPYQSIVLSNLTALQERPLPFTRPIGDYVSGMITGVVEGYQQLLRRIDALEHDFEGTIAVIRTKVELLLQAQNLAIEQQNLKMLASVDKTTKSQAILQHTVEGLSVIVIAYYLSGLANYIVKALHKGGWLANAEFASALVVPCALVVSCALIYFGRKVINKRLLSEKGASEETK